jgi:SPP1 gp7 family putative phage head morphogenesis protein
LSYWQDRNIASQQKLANKSVVATEKQLQKYYKTTIKKTIADFEATYDKLLATIEDGRQPTPADLYKLDKYWQMQAQLKVQLQRLGDSEIELLTKNFTKTYQQAYEMLALPSDKAFSTIDDALAEEMIQHVWCADGKSWSARVWENTEKLAETLNEELIACVVGGKKTTDLKNMLLERFNVSYSQADALVRTEIAHIQTQAAQKRYKDYGIDMVEIWADKDERRCDVCGKLHKKRYPVGAKVPIPAHPNCRCCIVPVVE